MSIMIIFGIGGAVGGAFAFMFPVDGRTRPFVNVAVGIIGAILGAIPAFHRLGARQFQADLFDPGRAVERWRRGAVGACG